MKILYISLRSAGGTITPDKEEDFFFALQKICPETSIYFSPEHAIEFKPDVIYVHSGSVGAGTLKRIKQETGALVVQWTGDCREHVLDPVLFLKDIADITLLACGHGKQREMYEKYVRKVEWFPHGVAEKYFLPVKQELGNKNIVFIGNNYSQFPGGIERMHTVEGLARDYADNFKIYGNGFNYLRCNDSTIPFEDSFELLNNSFISIGGNIFNDKSKYFSNRPLNAMAAGCCHIIREVPDMDYGNLLTYSNYMGLKKILDSLLYNDPVIRNKYAVMGQKWVKDNFSYDVLAEKFIQIINQQTKP